MKTTRLPLFVTSVCALSIMAATVDAKPRWKRHRNNNKEKKAERQATKEELILDKKDTHGGQGEAGKDIRPKSIHTYNKRTFTRIVALLKSGKIQESEGTELKQKHTEITTALAEAKKEGGGLTTSEVASIRGYLDQLNDKMTALAGPADEGVDRTPLLNKKQHKFEEKIEFGERSGRLSKGEASRLRRKLESLEKMEERLKSGDLSTRDRTRLHEKAIELKRELHKDLHD